MRKKMWHCKSCGRVCDSSNTVCPDCGLDLGFYGEIQFIETGEPEPSPPSVPQPQEQAKPAVEEERKPEIKEERKTKERKPKKEGKRGKVLIAAGVVLLALVGLGCFMSIRRVDGLFVGLVNYWNHNIGYYDNYYVENGSEATQEIGVYYKGFLGSWQELTVTSSDSSVVNVVSVEENADESDLSFQAFTIRLEAGNPGTAEITAKVGDESKSYQVHVYQITGVELTVSEGLEVDAPEELEVEEGIILGRDDSVSYTTSLQYTGEVGGEKWLPKVEMSSSDTDIVEVDPESGKLIAKEYGAAVITASVGEYAEEIYVSVSDVTGVTLVCYDLLVNGKGETVYWIPEGVSLHYGLVYSGEGPDRRSIPTTLESSDENVLSAHGGTITAVGPGTATVTYTKGNVSDSLTLEVYPVKRSSGSWVKGSIQTIAAPTEDGSSKADFTITAHKDDDVQYVSIMTYFGAGNSFSYTTGFEEVEGSDGVQACEATVTLQGSEWEQERSIAGIIFIFKKASSESGDFNPATDLLDYWVIYTE